jgi:hypothetical protein
MDVLGPETLCPYVGLIGASGGARQSSVIWRLRRARLSGASGSTQARLSQVRPDRSTATHCPCRTRSGPAQVRNALGGNTGSEPVPLGLAGPDRRSRWRSIGHKPYIAHHGVEPLVGVSEARSRSLGSVGTDPQPESFLAGPKGLCPGFGPV